MLTQQDLLSYFHDGIKSVDNCKIGLELEQFSYNKETNKPLPYHGPVSVSALLQKMIDDYGWHAYHENGNIIALKRQLPSGATQNLSLEPGGQIELSGAVHKNIADVKQEAYDFCDELYQAGNNLGIGFKTHGLTPEWTRSDFQTMPKQRYDIMKSYMPTVGTMGLDMMFRTCTVQLNMDYTSENDMIQKMRVALALQPLATAYFANSSVKEHQDTGYQSYRSHIWTNTDNDRTGMLPFMFTSDASFERYMQYALDVPMYFIKRNDQYINCAGQSFRAFMDGKLPALLNEYPVLSDWEDHLSTIFPEVRLKNFIEMRGADANPIEKSVLITDFWTHLIYNQEMLDECSALIRKWDISEIQQFRHDAAKYGLNAQTPDKEKSQLLLNRLFKNTLIHP